jgi:ABC-type multidrug transport system fused ATPase/permease subunit
MLMALSLRRQVFASLQPYRALFGFALAQVVLIGGIELLKPWPLKLIIDNVLGGRRLSWPLVADWSRETLLLATCIGLVVVYLILGALTMLNNYMTIRIGQSLVNDLRGALYHHLQRLSLAFHHRRQVGDLLYRITADAYSIQTLTMNGLFPIATSLVLLVGMTLVMLQLDWLLTVLALGLLAGTLLLSGVVKGANVVFSYVNRDMMTALTNKDAPAFFHAGLLILLYNVVAAPIIAIDGYVVGKLMIHWRQWLTEQLLARSFRDRAFYRISADPGVDNPDQRISEDLNAFAGFTVSFVLQVLWGVVTGASFLVVLWLISPGLVGVLAACVAVGSLLTIVIGRPLIGINFTQRRREADFRHALVRLRDNAEAIALYGGERSEEGRLLHRLYAVVKNSNLMILWQRNLAFFTYTYDFLLVLVPYFFLAPSFFAGTIAFGQITQASLAFLALRTALSIIVDQYNLLSTFAAVVERLGGYLEAAESPQVLETGGSGGKKKNRRRSRPLRGRASPSRRSRCRRLTVARPWSRDRASLSRR